MYTYVYIYIYIMHILHAISGETKNNGAHGGFGSLPVTCCFIGNIHSTPAIELLQGKRGDHGCQAGDIYTYTVISSVNAIVQFVCLTHLSPSLSIYLSLYIYAGKGPPQLRHGLSNPTTCRIRRVRRVRSHPDMERDPSHDLGGSIYIYIPVSGHTHA